ncbi:hypothetical protein [Microbacterium sp. SLBN-146]|uniref:hypothetical protein n=1 Tax=Microbacterium sp. SLBN-146 TaxID=2768457 RepID=UPI001152A444|nr:hypothetical protein [Microbacterium sp. SLBN-146]
MDGRTGIDLLLERGKLRVDELVALARELFASGAVAHEPIPGTETARVHIGAKPDAAWAFLAMEATHNVRCALDQLAWRLVEIDGGTPGRHTCFPIADKAEGYGAALKNALRGASQAHRDAVRGLMPYRTGDDRFPDLQDVDNTYKHRLMIPAVVSSTGLEMRVSLEGVEQLAFRVNIPGGGALTDGQVVVTPAPFEAGGGDGELPPMRIDHGVTVEVAFHLPHLGRTISVERLYECVHGIAEAIEPLVADVA